MPPTPWDSGDDHATIIPPVPLPALPRTPRSTGVYAVDVRERGGVQPPARPACAAMPPSARPPSVRRRHHRRVPCGAVPTAAHSVIQAFMPSMPRPLLLPRILGSRCRRCSYLRVRYGHRGTRKTNGLKAWTTQIRIPRHSLPSDSGDDHATIVPSAPLPSECLRSPGVHAVDARERGGA